MIDVVEIIELISSLVTIEEASYGWLARLLRLFNGKQAKAKIEFAEWDVEDETTQLIIDGFKSKMIAKYKEHIFQPDEINLIIKEFLKEKKYQIADYNQRKEISEFIRRTFLKYNEYNRSLMTAGERIIQDSIEETDKKIEKLDVLQNISLKTLRNIEKLLNSKNAKDIEAFNYAVKLSKNTLLDSIDNKINGEYSIDRNKLIKQIKNDGNRFISIQGNAGCGKSALCKNLISEESLILAVRSEELAHANHLNDVWNCDLHFIFKELADEKIIIYIDALEFIADYSDRKYKVLQELYDISAEFPKIYIVTSCRTSERNAFIKLHTKYAIKTYEVNDITESELDEICNFYPVIRELRSLKSYSELLKSPFYINLIVSNGISSLNIVNENAFRDYIWKNIICLRKKSSQYSIDSSVFYNAVNRIVFERAKKFLLGIPETEIQSSVLNYLVSEGIVIVSNGLIRLKYDVFEDICFEQYFDKVFDECRGKFEKFYAEISTLGRCVYRRYQIWIANKLFIKENRNKFLHNLLFSDCSDNKWRKQTEIGIAKSKYCNYFFEEYISELKDSPILQEILDVINLYAFEAKIVDNGNGDNLELHPIGYARESIIQLIFSEKLFIGNVIKHSSVVKLCFDCAKSIFYAKPNYDNSICDTVCYIIEHYLKIEIEDNQHDWHYASKKHIEHYLTILFMLADSSKEWLKSFFKMVSDRYLSENKKERYWARDIGTWILENAYYPALTRNVGTDLCMLANRIYFINGYDDKICISDVHEKEHSYGLSDNASSIYMSREDTFKYFLTSLFKTNLKVGFEWAIEFVNRAFENFVQNEAESVMEISVFFPEKKETKKYYANGQMWLCRIDEYQIPTIVSDIIYVLKTVIIEYLESIKFSNELFLQIAEWSKKEIYSKANNAALLSIIQEIGFHFQNELPGYALELASSYELLHFDIQRHLFYHPNQTQVLLEKQIMQTMFIPELKSRYTLDPLCDCNLQEYVLKTQLVEDECIRGKTIEIIEYLYSLADIGAYDSKWKLLAQKMDLRNSTIKSLGNEYYEISVVLPENNLANNVEKEKKRQDDDLKKKINSLMTQAVESLDSIDFVELDLLLDKVINYIEQDELHRIQYENVLVQLIVFALTNKNIRTERKGYICDIWVTGIKRIFENGTFVAEDKLVPILFKQLDEELPIKTRNSIKCVMLMSLIGDSNNGQIKQIAKYTQLYLSTNELLAQIFFTTILKLAEDEMNHQKFNVEYLKNKGKEDLDFEPNYHKRLSSVDHYICDHKEETGFVSKFESIVQSYLYEEKKHNISNFKLDNYDVRTLCNVTKCGITLQNGLFYEVVKQIILCFIEIDYRSDIDNSIFYVIGTNARYDVVHFLQREICKDYESFVRVIRLLFDEVNFDKFREETIELYLDVFDILVSRYFDAFKERDSRLLIEKEVLNLEEKIKAINNESVRNRLLQMAAMVYHKFYGDWNNSRASYSIRDKNFLNQQYCKYGQYYFECFIMTLYQMNIKELLPEILISVEKVFSNCKKIKPNDYENVISKHQGIVNVLILDAYLYNSDAIKKDEDLSNSYIHILEMLISLNDEKAAVLLDEFLIH